MNGLEVSWMASLSYSLKLLYVSDSTTSEISSLSLHDALPISTLKRQLTFTAALASMPAVAATSRDRPTVLLSPIRSEEHTSELQSHVNLVCRLLLEKKKIPSLSNSFQPAQDSKLIHYVRTFRP